MRKSLCSKPPRYVQASTVAAPPIERRTANHGKRSMARLPERVQGVTTKTQPCLSGGCADRPNRSTHRSEPFETHRRRTLRVHPRSDNSWNMPRPPGSRTRMVGIFVYNMTNTSGRRCSCTTGDKTWLRHWELATGQIRPATCIAKYCRRPAVHGAHVKDNSHQVTPWIVPFCARHNKRPRTQLIQLKPGSQMAAAARSDCT